MSEPDALPLANQEIDLDAAFESAIHHHQAGRLSQAEMLYQVVLQWLPDHPDANHNLGVIAVQLGNPEQALPLFQRAESLLAQPPELEEGREIHQPVPVDGERPHGQGDGIELGMDHHGVPE